MKIILLIIFVLVVRRFFFESKSNPLSVETTIFKISIEKITIPRIQCNMYYSVDAKADNGSMYSLLVPCSFEKCPIEVGQRATIVLDEMRYIIYKGIKFYDYTRYLAAN